MSPKVLILSAAAAIGVLAVGAAVAGPASGRCHGPRGGAGMHGGFGGFGGGYGFGPGARLHQLLDDLDLSAAQKESVKTILRDSHARLEPQLEQAHAAKRTLFEAAFAAAPDEDAVRQASESVAQAVSDLTLEMAHSMAAIRATLTPEQRQQLDETLAKHREHHEKRAEQFREFHREQFEEFLDSF